MTMNLEMLRLWLEAIRAELQELLGVTVTARTTEDIPQAGGAYRSMLLVEGPVHGALYIATSSACMVQFAQMAAGDPVDAHAAWTGEALEAWQRLLDAAGVRLATRLTQELPLSSQDRCTILMAETSAIDGMHLDFESGNAALETTAQQWLLLAGKSEIAVSASVQLEFSGEQLQVPATEAAPSSSNAQAENALTPSTGHKISDAELAQASSAVSEEDEVVRNFVKDGREIHNRNSSAADPVTPSAEVPKEDPREAQLHEQKNGQRPRQRLDLLLDIELEATLRFGALELPLREVLELGPGDVLALDRHVEEPVDLVVGDRIVARGEVVLVGGNFGLHVTEVAEPRSRLETIRCLF